LVLEILPVNSEIFREKEEKRLLLTISFVYIFSLYLYLLNAIRIGICKGAAT